MNEESKTAVRIVGGLGSAGIPSARLDARGQPVLIPCSTCHASGVGRPLADEDNPDRPVHGHIQLRHGELDCLACHDRDDRDQLHLADGTTLAWARAMELCGQCHGPQKRDYDHRSHGGLSGTWDASYGPQIRNHCVVCHDPHAPAYPRVLPAPPPNDRGAHGHQP